MPALFFKKSVDNFEIVTLYYSVIFKSGNMDVYRSTMRRLGMLFIMKWKRHHCDRATLSWLSDDDFHQASFQEYDQIRVSIWNVHVTDW